MFEYWAHEACLLPVEEWPLFAAQMREGGRRWYGDVGETHPHLADEILAEIRARGPLGSRHFEGTSEGGMWNWKPAKAMLDRLWNHGDLVIAGRQGFQRLYDLPERVIPKEVLDAPVPGETERLRRSRPARRSHARGALTEAGIVEHWRLRGGDRARPARRRRRSSRRPPRARRGRGRRRARARPVRGRPRRRTRRPTAVLLSPFDNLLWDRPFARRVLGFDHLIEVYKKEHERQYGYYVLPLLWRDRIVGRADLKSERGEGALVLKAFHREHWRPRFGRARRRARPGARPAPPRLRARVGAPLAHDDNTRTDGLVGGLGAEIAGGEIGIVLDGRERNECVVHCTARNPGLAQEPRYPTDVGARRTSGLANRSSSSRAASAGSSLRSPGSRVRTE